MQQPFPNKINMKRCLLRASQRMNCNIVKQRDLDRNLQLDDLTTTNRPEYGIQNHMLLQNPDDAIFYFIEMTFASDFAEESLFDWKMLPE